MNSGSRELTQAPTVQHMDPCTLAEHWEELLKSLAEKAPLLVEELRNMDPTDEEPPSYPTGEPTALQLEAYKHQVDLYYNTKQAMKRESALFFEQLHNWYSRELLQAVDGAVEGGLKGLKKKQNAKGFKKLVFDCVIKFSKNQGFNPDLELASMILQLQYQGDKPGEHIDKFEKIVENLEAVGATVTEEKKVRHFLETIQEYEPLRPFYMIEHSKLVDQNPSTIQHIFRDFRNFEMKNTGSKRHKMSHEEMPVMVNAIVDKRPKAQRLRVKGSEYPLCKPCVQYHRMDSRSKETHHTAEKCDLEEKKRAWPETLRRLGMDNSEKD